MIKLPMYVCDQCGKEEAGSHIPTGPAAGAFLPPKDWESEWGQLLDKESGYHSREYQFCSRSCRGHWLIATEGKVRHS